MMNIDILLSGLKQDNLSKEDKAKIIEFIRTGMTAHDDLRPYIMKNYPEVYPMVD